MNDELVLRLEKALSEMKFDETIHMALDIHGISKILSLLRADKVYTDSLDSCLQITFDKAEGSL